MQAISHKKEAHMTGVARYMYEYAGDYNIPRDTAYALGLLHDIGYLYGRVAHERNGAETLRDLGLNEPFVKAVENHQRFNAGSDSFEDRLSALLIEADMSIDAQGERVGLNKRLKDIKERYGKKGYDIPAAIEAAEYNVKKVLLYRKVFLNDVLSPDTGVAIDLATFEIKHCETLEIYKDMLHKNGIFKDNKISLVNNPIENQNKIKSVKGFTLDYQDAEKFHVICHFATEDGTEYSVPISKAMLKLHNKDVAFFKKTIGEHIAYQEGVRHHTDINKRGMQL